MDQQGVNFLESLLPCSLAKTWCKLNPINFSMSKIFLENNSVQATITRNRRSGKQTTTNNDVEKSSFKSTNKKISNVVVHSPLKSHSDSSPLKCNLRLERTGIVWRRVLIYERASIFRLCFILRACFYGSQAGPLSKTGWDEFVLCLYVEEISSCVHSCQK